MFCGKKRGGNVSSRSFASLFYSQHRLDRVHDVRCLWQCCLLEGLGVGHWRIDSTDSPHGSIEMEERFVLHDASANLRSDSCQMQHEIVARIKSMQELTALWPSLLNCHQMMSLLNGFEDGLRVEWTQRAQVDDFSFDALAGKFIGRFQSVIDSL